MDYRFIERCKVGDSSAIENFVQTYQQDVYRLALSILDDSSEAEDATQEALLAALRALDSFQGASSLKTWLFSITVNICRTRLQRQKRREQLRQILGGILQGQNNPSVEEKAMENESDAVLWHVIHRMDEKHRTPIVLRYYHELSVAEIAGILQIPEGTVHSRLNTAYSHKQAIQLINRRMDGLLNDSQRLLVEEHLRSCNSCRDYANHMEGLSAHLQNEFHRRWDARSGPSQTVMEQVMTKSRNIPTTNRISSGVKLLAGAMALMLLGVTINFVVSRLQSTAPAANATEAVEAIDNAPRPEERLLAFTSDQTGNSDIYTMHADGSGQTNLTNNPARDSNPIWSPDGKHIAFESDRDGFTQIYLMDADGSNVIQLTHNEAHHFLPMNIHGESKSLVTGWEQTPFPATGVWV